ncbi:Nitrogen regulation protein C [Oligella ureolytica]|uniref:Helix-turn-helix transcriptional regulator n=1 Tax=Oligella ureolytica TaxID=90244 RepID=A0A378XEC1_9BURK|nr:LuxR C-terminal-related transcriptional regulator [Oligella ureolytica]NLP32532.1 helix-turn-helix transcriptional regulator [Oligella ureolytica]QPT41022.1 helix-turn-helix transcriptional regulator [Oligella ureolytica]SUA53464.1 Nitrogen regulation protein C [Oligella ureolytica]SUA53534.1 Nitrogen regulation protein C [Oligella ureolytica]
MKTNSFNKKQATEKHVKANKADEENKLTNKNRPFTMDLMTNREREIFLLIKKGLTSKECAIALDLSVRTVEVHRTNLIQKYNVKNIVELVFRINQEERIKNKHP